MESNLGPAPGEGSGTDGATGAGEARGAAYPALSWLPAITGMRGAAALMVVFYHGGYEWALQYKAGLVPALRFGWIGVDFFFVLSGFLLTLLAVRRPVPLRDLLAWREYAVGRILRIVPAYYGSILVVLGTSWLVWAWLGDLSPFRLDGVTVVGHLLLIQNFLPQTLTAINPVYWTLAIELQFYLVLPVLVWLLRPRWMAWSLPFLIGLGLAWRWFLYPVDPVAAFFHVPAYLPHFALGVAGAHLYISGRRIPRRWELPTAAINLVMMGAVLLAFHPDPMDHSQAWGSQVHHTVVRPLLALGFVYWIFIALAHGSVTGGLLASRPLQWIGDASYSIYLVHVPLIVTLRFLGDVTTLGAAVYLLIAVGLSVLGGIGFYHAVEKPAMILRKIILEQTAIRRSAGRVKYGR